MRPGGGKSKGNQFERDVCVALSLWLTNGLKKDCLWRSAISGGRSTMARKKGELIRQMGDITAVSPEGHKLTDAFYVECKTYADINFLGLLTGKGKLVEFWIDTMRLATMHKKLPMLIVKQNRVLPVVCLCHQGAKDLGLEKRALLIAPLHNMRIIPFHELLKSTMGLS
jgi:hypothetical protein